MAALAPDASFAEWIALLLWMYAAFLMQLIVHEAGHLVFGLLTGYRFASFRIGNLIWIARDGGIRLCRYSLAGTGGQCLMKPPETVDGSFPIALYNLGGSILNALSGLVFLLLGLCAGGAARIILAVLAIPGFLFALVNGIPVRGMLDNDGRNALLLRRDAAARRAFWIQTKMNELQGDGVRLRDMSEEWFAMPADSELSNGLIAELAAFRCNRLLDAHRFDEAARTMDHLLSCESALPELFRRLLICDRAYCALLGGESAERVSNMLDDKWQKKIMKAMRDYPSVLRTRYARALLLDRDEARSAGAAERFEAVAARYPYPAEIEGERALMALAKERAEAHRT